jgi:predicted lactoylglutathione lyase
MIDHIWLPVSDYEKSKAFYTKLLSPLDLKPVKDRPLQKRVGFDTSDKESHSDFWIVESNTKITGNMYCIAFKARNKEMVDSFHKLGIEAGGSCNGKPGYRENYHPGYYAAYIIDPDGYNIEAVFDERFGT